MKKIGLVCILLVVMSGLCWAQTGWDLNSATTPTKEMTPATIEQKDEAPASEKAEWTVPMALPEAAPVAAFPLAAYLAPADVDYAALEAEAATLTEEILAIKATGRVPSDALYEQLMQKERVLFGRDHDVSSLDQGAEDCSAPTVIPASDNVAFCESGIMGTTDDCTIGAYTGYKDVFYQFTPTVTGAYIISNCGSVGDLYMKIWNTACCGAAVWKLSDDSCGGVDPLSHQVLTAGVTYYFEIGYYSSTQVQDAYNMNLWGPLEIAAPPVPANDVCATATPISAPISITGTLLGSASETQSITCGGTTQSYWGVYYSIVGNGSFLTARTQNNCSSFNSRVRVYKGTCAALVCVGGNDDATPPGSTGLSSYSWCADAGVTYYIIVSSYNTAAVYKGPFTLDVTEGARCACDEIPLCGDPRETEPNNTCATADGLTLNCEESTVFGLHCAEPDSDFYRIVVPAGRGAVVKVYDGEGCTTYPPTKVTTKWYTGACVASGSNSTAAKAFSRCGMATDTTVYLCVLDYGAATPLNRAAYKVVVECVDPVDNDICYSAMPVDVPSQTPGNNFCGATYDAGLPACAGIGLPLTGNGGVWYRVTGNGHTLTADLCTSSFDTRMIVYTGNCDALVCVGSNDNGGLVLPCNTLGSKVSWCSTDGWDYFILVYGYSSTYFGNFVLNISDGELCAPPPNDACVDAIEVGAPSSTNGYTNFGGIDAPTPFCYGTPATPGVWYKVKGNGHELIAGLCTSSFDTKMNVWSGPDCATLTCVGGDNDACDVPNTQGSKYTWCSVVDVWYWILVYGSSTSIPSGTFTLTIEDNGYCGPAENDLCAGATLVAIPSATNGTTKYNTPDTVPVCATYAPTATNPGVWYKVIGNGNFLTADLCANYNFDNRLNVYSGDCETLVCVDADDDDCSANSGATVTWCSDPGVVYYLLAYGYSTYFGTFTLTITDGLNCHVDCPTYTACGTPAETEPNDACANSANFLTLAYAVDGSPLDYYGTICPAADVDYWYAPAIPLGSTLTITLFEGTDCSSASSAVKMYGATATDGTCTTPGTTALSPAVLGGCTPFTGGYVAVKKVTGYENKYKLQVTWTPAPACPPVVLPNQYSLGPCVGPIADNTLVFYPINVPIQYHITDLNVRITLFHSYVGDVDVYLVTPWLDTLDMTTANGGGGDNFINTVFDDAAATSITTITLGDAPYTGSYQPEEALAAVNQLNAMGMWQFGVGDHAGGDVGSSYCLTLEFEYDYILAVELTNGFVATPGNGSVSLSWATASETDNARFDILRDNEVIGTRNGQGTSSSHTEYSFTDEGLNNGRTYTYSLVAVTAQGERATVATVSAMPSMMAGPVTEYALRQNYPNPFNPTTTIAFDLLENGFVTLKIYNVMGQSVATVVNGTMNAGRHSVAFDASNLSSGVYLYRIEANGFSAEKKMLLMK